MVCVRTLRQRRVSSLGPGAFILRGVEEAASIDSSRAAMFSSSRLQTWEGAMIGRASLLLSLCIFASVAWAVQQQERQTAPVAKEIQLAEEIAVAALVAEPSL
jgi:hypothetical protein